ncbi:MAG: hypothetical protein MUE51_12505, partial [Thermoleophilia bacterium]|nr:hypothetical protein [Thermoleophilia bacterium]
LGLPHAGQGCPGTGVGESQQGEPWAGDDQGRLQGVRFDPASGDRSVDQNMGASPFSVPLFDLMSYCAGGDANAWLSPRNWNRLQERMEILAQNPPKTDASLATEAALAPGVVLGSLDASGRVTIDAVLPAGTVVRRGAEDPASRLRLQAFDRSGRPLPASGALLEEIDDVPGLSSFEAPLPAGATRFELTLGGAVVASGSSRRARAPARRAICASAGPRAIRTATGCRPWCSSRPATRRSAPSSSARARARSRSPPRACRPRSGAGCG